MKQLFIFASALMMSAFAFAGYPIEGTWGITQSQNGFTFDASFKIENNTVTATNVCSYNGQKASASVTAPAAYDANTFTISTSAEAKQSSGGLECTASLVPMSVNYVVQGSTLTLTMKGSSDSVVMTRR